MLNASWKSLWRILTLHCVEASRLTSESLDHPLPVGDRLAMRLHRISCGSCRKDHRQLLALRQTTSRLAEAVDPPSPPLPDETRERIKRTLKDS